MTDAADLFPATTAATMVNLAGAISLWNWAQKNDDPDLAQTIEALLGEAGQQLTRPIEELRLSVRAYSALQRLGIYLVGELAAWEEEMLLRLGERTTRLASIDEEVVLEIKEKLWKRCKLTLRGADEPTGE